MSNAQRLNNDLYIWQPGPWNFCLWVRSCAHAHPCASTSVTATQMYRFRRPQRPASDLWVREILQNVPSEYYTLHDMFMALTRGHTQLFRCRVHVVYDIGYSFQTGRALCICPRLACSRTCPLPPLSASSRSQRSRSRPQRCVSLSILARTSRGSIYTMDAQANMLAEPNLSCLFVRHSHVEWTVSTAFQCSPGPEYLSIDTTSS